jgi:hypothetical protein
LFEASIHFILFDELAPVGLCNAFPHSGAEPGTFGLDPGRTGHPRKFRFLFRVEMYIHG